MLTITSTVESNISVTRKLNTVLVIPGNTESTAWHNPHASLIHDVDENGVYQSFKKNNSAYFDGTLPEEISTESINTIHTNADVDTTVPVSDEANNEVLTPESDTSTENVVEISPVPIEVSDLQTESDTLDPETSSDSPETDSVPEPTPEASISPEVSLFEMSTGFYSFTNITHALLPLANESVTTPLVLESPVDEIHETISLPAIPSDTTTEHSELVTSTEQTEEIIQTDSLDTDSSAGVIDVTQVESSQIAQDEKLISSDFDTGIVFSDFSIPQLNSGQFIRNVQLRMSLGALRTIAIDEIAPSIEVEYTVGDEWINAGTVLLDGEVSNALNGGYFLFALPKFGKSDELGAFEIRVSYKGNTDILEHVYIDALWLEFDTETFDKNLLKERLLPQGLTHLRFPSIYDLLSTDLDFTREENPKFTLRYESQRNPVVRFFRNLLGRKLADVMSVRLDHVNSGPIPVSPQIDVTPEGLITVQLTDADKKNLRPGEYTLEILVDEGGKIFSDSFSFQWGMLAVNPLQSEYQIGDTTEIALGALTRNGNTLCDANLLLYVIDPAEYIHEVLVSPSGLCSGNNVIDVPDYSAVFTPTTPGTYEMYVERVGDNGEVLSHTSDTFMVVGAHGVSIARNGPTRIYPPSMYPMQITVSADADFNGTITERVPRSFTITNTDARIEERDDVYELSWDVTIARGESATLSYEFDAPDLSPFLYTVGPATLTSDNFEWTEAIEVGTTTASTTGGSLVPASYSGAYAFTEHRDWQIASDATGNMLLFWDNANGIPTGWTCVSCAGGDVFYQRFIQGSSTYNNTGGTTTHTHTATSSVLATSSTTLENFAGTSVSNVSHTHTIAPTIASASNLPAYRQLQVIQYTASAGEPASIPTGAIGIFDATVPAGWTQYNSQNGYYIRGESTIGTTGGSDTHTHDITGTTTAAAGATVGNRGAVAAQGAPASHTHTISTSTVSTSIEPPYVTVMFGQLTATATAPNGLITMWTDAVPTSWLDVSSSGADAFNNKFLKATSTYGSTGGASSHTQTDMSGIPSSAPIQASLGGRAGSTGASSLHSHSVSITSFDASANLPPYVTVIFGKRQGNNPTFTQLSSRWYVNSISAQTPTDPWPSGITDLSEREGISATSTPVKNDDVIRLRISAQIGNATATASSSMKLQYASTTGECSAISTWYYVGAATSTSEWRGFNNSGVSDHGTLTTLVLASSTVKETYEENGYSIALPNQATTTNVAEWDFVLEQNGARAGTTYCFRMVESDGTVFYSYSHYPKLLTNYAPVVPTLSKPFDNEKFASTSPWFEFVTTDPESQDLNYQLQIDNDADFSSTVVDHDTENNGDNFLNLVVGSDKDPFTSGQLMRYSSTTALNNGTTYWWRVRARDPLGSNQWGDWATSRSFTIDTSLTASTWFQTTEEQFDTSGLDDLDATGADQVQLASGSTTGTYTSDSIDFDDRELGTAWDSLSWSDTETSGDIKYSLEYLNTSSEWGLIPDSALPGNSAGYDSSPVILLDLDTDTYNELRIIGTFTDSGGSPSLQDITLSWGYRVETPDISRLFPNEKVGTTTPTFEFVTTDPQLDDLTYQISWSQDNTFTSSTTRTSDTHAGFINADTGGNFDPFYSGDTIQFTVQASDVLTNGATYWWRVRAKDTTGDNAYSLWTEARSFTVDTTVVVSTWFQTTEEQFDTNILSGTNALASDVVAVATTAVEAMLVYGEGVATSPRYRQWNGSVWGSEGMLSDIGAPLKWAVVRAGTTREEYVSATLGTDSDINAQVFTLGAWGNIQEMTASVSDYTARGFDVAYEIVSGRAMVAYCDGDADPGYYLWNGSTWAIGTSTINLTTTSNCAWVRLASNPISNEIIILTRDTVGAYEAQVWNATTSSWGNASALGSITDVGNEGMAVEYEESGNQAIIITSDGNPARFRYNVWSAGAWAGSLTQSIGNDFEWGDLVQDDGSDELALCYLDEDQDIGMVQWTGSAWTGQTELNIDGNSKTDPAFSCVYETTVGRDNYLMTVLSNSTSTDYHSWNNTAWSSATNLNSIGDSATMKLIRTGIGMVLGIFFDDPNDSLLASSWNGSSWATTTTIENNASVDTVSFGHPYALTPRNSGREGTVIVSPGIEFSDGTGPYWDSMSWVDSTPGSSEILYSVQYYNTASGTWNFVPDAVIPGNSSGTTTSPIDLSSLEVSTYSIIRPYAELSCDGSNNCPTLSDWTVTWAEGITISGTLHQYDRVSSTTSGTVAVAVDGVLQIGKTGTVSNGSWSISNVTTFAGDIITVFLSGANDVNEAVGITRYDGTFDITGLSMYERHLALGSDDATTTVMTNGNIGLYDYTNDEDIFSNEIGTTLSVCVEADCADAELVVKSGVRYQPTGSLITHDFENNGTFLAQGNTIVIGGSWDNNATATLATSTVIFSATSTSETIDGTGSSNNTFYNLTFATTTSSATWTAVTTLDVDNNLTVSFGTLSRAGVPITVGGNLITGASGFWSGIASTTFDGSGTRNWSDSNATLQNVGRVAIDGSSKTIQLSGNVKAQSIFIGTDDVLDVSTSNYDITLFEDWINNNTFVARSGEVFMSATTTNKIITAGSDAFYDLTFNGAGGAWSFTEPNLSITNNLTIATGTVTMPIGTTTLSGSFSSVGGTFAHNNATVLFDASSAKTISASGTPFTNAFYNMTFSGSGSWSFLDTSATTSNDLLITQGTVTFPSANLSVGGSFTHSGGTFAHNSGTVKFTSASAETIDISASSFNSISFNGTGSWSFIDPSITALGSVWVSAGTVTLPSNTLTIGGSYGNFATVNHASGTVLFNSTDGGETINLGNSSLYNMTFNSVAGGWTISAHATTTNNFTLSTTSVFTLASGQTLSVGGVFTNAVSSASTTWTGSTLSLEAGNYSINTKTNTGDTYDTLRVKANTDIKMWNGTASTYVVDSTGSLYSQDHAGVDGDLYIYGNYPRTSGNEYWSYATDFDGTALNASTSRQVDVRFASGASASITGSLFEILGTTTATTTIANQGSGTYVISSAVSTTTYRYYDFDDLGTTGVSLSGSGVVTTLADGAYEPGIGGGTGLTVSSTTIDANPGLQIYRVDFSTTTAISATNVTQIDATPVSYWWFRESIGNIDGESFDNDTGDPGSIRWDDSSLSITISGTVYSDDGTTPMGTPICDDVTQNIRIVVQDGSATTTSCASADGTFSKTGVVIVGSPVVAMYLDTDGGPYGSVITKTPTADITDLALYQNSIITRHEDIDGLTISDMAVFDTEYDTDIRFNAATGTTNTLNIFAGSELHIASSTTFDPGGDITINANASSSSQDGSLHIDDNATFTGSATSTYTFGGSFTMDQGATFTSASTTVLLNASTTGKTITTTASQEITFNNLIFNGLGGGWNINGDIRAVQDIAVTTGTVTGTSDVTVVNGSLSGAGVLSFGSGTTTINSTNTLGGTTAWTFGNLVLGSGSIVGTTTPGSNATTTILGKLTISNAHFLNAQGSLWNLAGTGNVFVETGTFVEGTSTVRYSGVGATNVHSTTYYNLDLKSQGSSPTYTASGLGIIVSNNLTVGGPTTTAFTLETNDPALDVNGNVTIDTTGTLVGSGSGIFSVGGDWDNNGTFTGSGGTVTFDSSGTSNVYAGNSVFANATINGSGTFVIQEHATATNAFTLTNATSFTVSSGQTLAVGGTFTNGQGGAVTTWTGATLSLYGGGNYSINASTTNDTYSALVVGGTTQIRMWNSSASSYDISTTGSLYSQDHNSVNGDLYIYGAYTKTTGNDYWNYSTDFDGTDITGSERNVDVYIASGGSVLYTGGGLSVLGVSSATTTIQNQGSGTYTFRVGGNASTTWNYYHLRNLDSAGLTFSGTPNVVSLSYGDVEVSQNSGSAMTVGGTVITQNPAETFTGNIFASSTGVSPAYNVTATGTSVSSWRFTQHTGNIAGEAFDVDPDGDPGYIAWQDSQGAITVSGNVYSDEGSSVSTVCDSSSTRIRLIVNSIASTTLTSCNGDGAGGGTGYYQFTGVQYADGNTITVYIDGVAQKGVTVTEDPISNITNMDLYENRVVVRHEGSDPLSIADMTLWDSGEDPDIPFTAVAGSPDTLTLPANRKLLVWTGKEFEPNGNVTLSGGGGGSAYDGTLELQTNALFTASAGESHSIGGSLITSSGATFSADTSSFTFTTSGSNRTIDTNEATFYDLVLNGSGSWLVSDTLLTIGNDFTITQGTVTLPSGTTTVTGSFNVTGGSWNANGGIMFFNSSASEIIKAGGSNFNALTINGSGSFTMQGTNATATADVLILNGTFTSATGTLTIGGDFINDDIFNHGSGVLRFIATSTTLVTASSSDLYTVTFAGSGPYSFTDNDVALLGSLNIQNGAVNLASGTMSIAGSLLNTGGSFNHSSGTILFNSSDTGETVNPGTSPFHVVSFASAGGGWTISGNATTTSNFSLTSATNFTLASSTRLTVGGVFTNLVGGANTTWTGSTLVINSGTGYTINSKVAGGDVYNNVIVGSSTALRAWDSSGMITMGDAQSSLYSQDHAGVSGTLYIYGEYLRTTGTDYWSYATDFDGTALGGSSRQAFVYMGSNASTTFTGGTLNIVGANGFDTTISNQGSGTYTMDILGGTFNAQYYSFANMDADGLTLSGTTTITSLTEGNFTLAVNGGSLITLSSTTLNYNAGLIISGTSFATTTAITGANVTLVGTTPSSWTFTGHSGNFDGEIFDNDGVDDCGSIRWSDSVCLLTTQSGYRFRNDDGGEGVPNSEWYDLNWSKRKRVSVSNVDATSYTDATVKLTVTYDADMQTDFDDLRFTDSNGTTLLSHFRELYTASTDAVVWVKIPTLATSTDTEIYMYYGNGGVSDASATSTFSFIDTFEDGNISEYSGDTPEFLVDGADAYERTYRLEASDPDNGKTDLGGMYNNSVTVNQGKKLRVLKYINTSTGSGDEVCTTFGTQNQTQNYAVCLELFGIDRLSLAKNVLHRDTSGTVLASTTVTYSTGWYEIEVGWDTDNSIFVTLSQNGSVVATTSATDSTYTTGGIGYTLWGYHGGWDVYSARPLLQTEPTVTFGFEQVSGGASWLTALNTPGTGIGAGDKTRVRFLVENTGLPITNQNYEIEFASKGASPSCEAVAYGNYVEMPNVASCGTSALCMESSTQFTNLASTTDVLGGIGTFTQGQIVEDPSNNTGNISVNGDEYTELEYIVIPTVNASDSNYCLRVSNEGNDLDSYTKVAELQLFFAPNITALSLNGGIDITLTGGATTTVTATGTVTDQNGYTDLAGATSTIFRSGVGESCSLDNNSCYISGNSLCSFVNCSGNSCDVECTADIYYHADPTDIGTFGGETWRALLAVSDFGGSIATATAPSIDLLTLRAISVDSSINYGSLAVNADTGSYNATTTVVNIGNDALDVLLEGTDLTDGGSSAIPVTTQRFATSTFTYSACVYCTSLSSTTTNYKLDLAKPASTTPAVTDQIFWGISVPFGVAGTPHQGTNIFYATVDTP